MARSSRLSVCLAIVMRNSSKIHCVRSISRQRTTPCTAGIGPLSIMPASNTEAMNLHLAEIAATVAPAAHAILLVDQAGWHLSTRLLVPANITIILLPPKCPELNPVENVWQFMRDNWLSNRIFKSYDDLVDHCCAAWNKLVDQPWRIMSIGLRQWAHGF